MRVFGECEWMDQTMNYALEVHIRIWRNLNGKSGTTLPAVGVPWLQGSSTVQEKGPGWWLQYLQWGSMTGTQQILVLSWAWANQWIIQSCLCVYVIIPRNTFWTWWIMCMWYNCLPVIWIHILSQVLLSNVFNHFIQCLHLSLVQESKAELSWSRWLDLWYWWLH